MTARSGIGAQMGFGLETVWGTAVAPTVFHPFTEESLSLDNERLESEGIIAGARTRRSYQWEPGGVTVSGSTGMDLPTTDTGLLLRLMMGGASSADGSFTPADLESGTIQIGTPDATDGTVRPRTYAGMKCSSWEIAATAGEYATLGIDWVGKHEILHRTVADGATNSNTTVTSATAVFDESDIGKPISGTGIPAATTITAVASATSVTISAAATATATGVTLTIGLALTSASYAAAPSWFGFYDATVTIAGTAYSTQELTIAGDNGLDADRRYLGTRTIGEPLEAGLRAYTGSINSEFFSDAAYRRFVRGDEAALVATFTKGARSLVITQNVRFDGETPNVGSREIVKQNLPYTSVGPTTDAGAITMALDTVA